MTWPRRVSLSGWLLVACCWALPAQPDSSGSSGILLSPALTEPFKTPRTLSPQPETTLQKYLQLVAALKDTLTSLRKNTLELQQQLASSQTTLIDLRQSLEDSRRLEQSLSERLVQAQSAVQAAQQAHRSELRAVRWRWVLVALGTAAAGLLAGLLIG